MVLLQNQLLGSSHEKWTHLKWRPNNTFGSKQKAVSPLLKTLGIKRKHPEGIKKASGKRFYLSPLLSRPPFSNQSKDHWRNYTNCSTGCWWSQSKKSFYCKVVYPYQAERISTQNPNKRAFPLTSSSRRQDERWNGLDEGSCTGLSLIFAKMIQDMTEKTGNFHATLGSFRPWLTSNSSWSWINHKERSSSDGTLQPC
jgi:hypothetical protein